MRVLLPLLLLTSTSFAQPWFPALHVYSHGMEVGKTGRIETVLVSHPITTVIHAFHASFTVQNPGWSINGDRAEPVLHSLNRIDPLFFATEVYGNYGFPFLGWGLSGQKTSSTLPDSPHTPYKPSCCTISIPADPRLRGVVFYVQGILWCVGSPIPYSVTPPLTVRIG